MNKSRIKLHISRALSLPADAVTSTIVVYGGKGMGKTNFASVLVEEFASAGLRFVVIDPTGVWWGLRHDESGKGVGVKVLILGGMHGDLPITPESGSIVADLVVDEDANVIIDISRRADGAMWSIGERVRFVTDYAKRLYQRQGEKRRPIMQVIDEAARFAPQLVRAGDMDVAKCMGAIAVIVEEGRNVGLGVTLVTQRSARLNKDVAELADCMIAFRTLGPNSVRAVLDWLGEHVEKSRLKDIAATLRELPRGSALVVSPGWLEFEDIVAMRKRRTFDSSKTPEYGKQVSVSGTGATPDLEKYRARMAAVVERAKENDPTALKRQVAALRKELLAAESSKQPKKAETKVEIKTIEKRVIDPKDLKRLEEVAVRFNAQIDALGETRTKLVDTRNRIVEGLQAYLANAEKAGRNPDRTFGRAFDVDPKANEVVEVQRTGPGKFVAKFSPPTTRERSTETVRTKKIERGADGKLPPVLPSEFGKSELRLIESLAWWESIGVPAVALEPFAFVAGYKVSGNFNNLRGKLHAAELVEYLAGSKTTLTAAGKRCAPPDPGYQSLQDLHGLVIGKLTEPQARLFRPILAAYPDGLAMDALAEASGYTLSGNFNNLRGHLHTFGLVEYRPKKITRACDWLFPPGLD